MSKSRPAPRWGLLAIAYIVASLAAGLVMALVENFGVLTSLTTAMAGSGSILNLAASSAIYALIAGVSFLVPALVLGAGLWWFGIDNLGAYVICGAVAAGVLVSSGLGDISLLPSGPAAGLVMWLVMRLFGGKSPSAPDNL